MSKSKHGGASPNPGTPNNQAADVAGRGLDTARRVVLRNIPAPTSSYTLGLKGGTRSAHATINGRPSVSLPVGVNADNPQGTGPAAVTKPAKF